MKYIHSHYVEEFNYTTLSIVFSEAVTGVGARIGFPFSGPGNSSFVWPRISRPPITGPQPNLARSKKTIFSRGCWNPRQLRFAVPPLGGWKGKPLPPNFSKTGRPIAAIFVPLDSAHVADQAPEILVS